MKQVKLEGPGCYGCGARLQVSYPGGPGYLRPDVYELKRTHRQLGETLCGRCTELAHGKMVPAVGGNGGHGSGGQQEGYVMAEDLREQLKPLKLNKVLVVKLVDIADFNGSFLSKVRDLVGSNPIILVGTKVDLLPADTDLEAVADWVWEATVRKKLKPISLHVISSLTGAGLPSLAANIQRERQGRDVYVLGAANVGKSAFINALLAELATRDPAAAAARRKRPTESAMPGTTLGPIPINAFSGGGELFDTPGIHLHHRLASLLTPEELVMLTPRRRLRPVAPTIGTVDQTTAQENGAAPHTEMTAPDSENGASESNGSNLTPGDFVVLRPHPSCPPQAIFIAQVSASGVSETAGSEGGGTLLARPWMPKPVRRGPKMDLWNDPWGRKWVPYEGGMFELAPDDVIASWQSRAKAPEEGVPVPPLVAARVDELIRGGNLPAPAYPPWVDESGEIVSAKEWGGKVGVLAGEGSANMGDIVLSRGAVSSAEKGGSLQSEGIEGTTFFWGGVARVDVLQAPPGLRLFFYGPHTVTVHAVDSQEADAFYEANLFEKLTPPYKDRGANWDGLPYKKECNLYSEDDVRPAGDVVVSGLGWFAVGGAPGKRGRRGGSQSSSRGEVRLLVHTPRGVEVYLRPSMPVTETGAEWADRPDLDVELERPPIYYPRHEPVSRTQGVPSRQSAW
ncbi:Nitric oxide synthase [Klebsormidium nitens]|uniref:Nitric oxide synthase n=1 Tax=Klebsormidium nitens TaxID=105231 RepID=A0A1Y1IGS9_KLENI|nr:Nitric oxide synthase [Klebsormidium nitens]|eukprot:GAQ87348.1 Nitric oxide synthase [Klebsormidium nitens]